MMVLAFVLAVLTWLKMITVWEVVVLAFLNGMANAMNAPSYQALVPRLVPREDLTNAIALNSAQFNMSRILGPTLGGYAMAVLGMAGNFFLNGLSFLAVLFALMQIEYPEQERAQHPSYLTSLARRDSATCGGSRQMLVLMWMTGVASLLVLPFITFIPFFARMQLHVGRDGAGLADGGVGTGRGAGRGDGCGGGHDSASRAGWS